MTKRVVIFLTIGIVVLLLVVFGVIAANNQQTKEQFAKLTGGIFAALLNQPAPTPPPTTVVVSPAPVASTNTGEVEKDPLNTTYTIEGKEVRLVDGKAQNGSTMTELFDSPITGDLTGDKVNDAGVILVVSGSGSGTFYYAAAAINNPTTYTYAGTNALFLGDRISPQTKSISNQVYTVNYADRKEGEPMSATPSAAVSKYFKVNGTTLTETEGQ